eukprot:CAMPEP_0206057968 /NCGR_PEP_ID=MMETSP1466-20131121/45572_1 /ASSEMBLY_ACC=CAM_ASM_001126 /TAXON_ID=44452 /ORGANISM="Pavlova gyrans, Strain CCMP608" /LENGTH=60 /DNA_ID=CAMNT_0053433259 /DNA_START=33 /DNA_END=212 /DNA_ORIENTATION=-
MSTTSNWCLLWKPWGSRAVPAVARSGLSSSSDSSTTVTTFAPISPQARAASKRDWNADVE